MELFSPEVTTYTFARAEGESRTAAINFARWIPKSTILPVHLGQIISLYEQWRAEENARQGS